MNLAKNFASRREILSRFPSRSRFYFGRQGSCRYSRKCIPARISTRFAAGSWRDFGRRDFCFPARITARFAARSRRDFGRRDFCFPARITARFPAGSRRDFGRREFRFPVRILPGSRRDSRREKKSRRPKSRRDPGGIPVEIAAGSRQDPGPYFTRVVWKSQGS